MNKKWTSQTISSLLKTTGCLCHGCIIVMTESKLLGTFADMVTPCKAIQMWKSSMTLSAVGSIVTCIYVTTSIESTKIAATNSTTAAHDRRPWDECIMDASMSLLKVFLWEPSQISWCCVLQWNLLHNLHVSIGGRLDSDMHLCDHIHWVHLNCSD